MTIEVDLRALILAAPAVAALVGDRGYPVILPQGATFPAFTYQRISGGTRVASHAGDSGLTLARIQVDCWASTYLAAKAACDAIRRALQEANRNLARGVVLGTGSAVFRKIDVTLDRDDYEDEEVLELYRSAFDVLTWFKED